MAAPNTKVGAAEIGGNVWERGLLWRCWFLQSSVLQVSAVPISAGWSLFLCELGLKLWSSKFSMEGSSYLGSPICGNGARLTQQDLKYDIHKNAQKIRLHDILKSIYDDEEHILLWRWKFIRDEGDDPDPKVACRPPHHQPGPHHLSCTALNQRIGDAANLMQFIALRYGLYCEAMQNGPKFEFKWIISFLDGLVEGEPGKACF